MFDQGIDCDGNAMSKLSPVRRTLLGTLLGGAILTVPAYADIEQRSQKTANNKRIACSILAEESQKSRIVPILTQHLVVSDTEWLGKCAIKLELTGEEQARQLAGAAGNRPTLAILGTQFADGVIEANVAATINGLGGRDTRGFVGIAFDVTNDLEKFQAVYLRMSNGTLNTPRPPTPRDVRAIQYVAHPDFHFDKSRLIAPGRYEKAAPVKVGRWHKLRLKIHKGSLTAFVDGKPVIQIDDLKNSGNSGQIGLWVGDGTTAYLSEFRVIRK